MRNAQDALPVRSMGSNGEDTPAALIVRILGLIVLAVAATFVGAFLYVSLQRLAYPFALEWMEGTSLVQVHRILSGRLLYVEPSLDFVPLIYPPLYYYVSASLATLVGPGFLPLRLVSLLATIGCFGCIFLLTHRLQPNLLAQLISVGLFAATFQAGGAWFDVARVDMLALFLALSSLVWIHSERPSSQVLAAVFMTLAWLTKQTYLVVLIATAVYSFWLHRKAAWPFVFVLALGMVTSVAALGVLHGRWYAFFVFGLPYAHTQAFYLANARSALLDPIIAPVCVLFLFAVADFIGIAREQGNRARIGFFLVVGAALVASWLGLINPGGYNNVIIPSHAMLSVLAGAFLARTLKGSSPAWFRSGVLLLFLLQLSLLRYPIADQIPTTADSNAGAELLQNLLREPGDVYVPYHPELMLLAGRKSYADWTSLYELSGGFGGQTDRPEWRKVNLQLRRAIRNGEFDLILLDREPFWAHPERYYQLKEVAYPDATAFYPVTGWQIRPSIAYYLND